jgi:hypothetical protein
MSQENVELGPPLLTVYNTARRWWTVKNYDVVITERAVLIVPERRGSPSGARTGPGGRGGPVPALDRRIEPARVRRLGVALANPLGRGAEAAASLADLPSEPRSLDVLCGLRSRNAKPPADVRPGALPRLAGPGGLMTARPRGTRGVRVRASRYARCWAPSRSYT